MALCSWFFFRQVNQIHELGQHQGVNQPSISQSSSREEPHHSSAENFVLGLPDVVPSSLVVDILSVGSVTRLDYLQAQKATFGSHITVRNFFNVTELDDPDQNCSTKLRFEDVKQISMFCKNKRWDPKRQFLMSYLAASYASSTWLAKKSNPAGWICAQNRPAVGLHKVLSHYGQQLSETNQPSSTASTLPDYLIVMDDDTFYNMDLFEQQFAASSSSIPLGIAGCIIRSPIRSINFTIPFGGFGMIMSRGYIQYLMKPINCEIDKQLCHAIYHVNHIDEKNLFREGMSLGDLVYSYATNQPYTSYKTWKTGFCLHSDWLFGYITNFYNASRHVAHPAFADVPHARLDSYMNSELYAGNIKQGGRGNCDFDNEYCNSMSHACHYSNPQRMRTITDTIIRRVPHKFRTSSAINPSSDKEMLNSKPAGEKIGSTLVFDILSIASTPTSEDQQTQQKTFTAHSSVRNFFKITPADDLDRNCSENISEQDVESISAWCHSFASRKHEHKWLEKGLRGLHGKKLGTEHRASWLCSQHRPIVGFYKAVQHYRKTMQDFPDYLLIVKDNTYYNIEALQEMLVSSSKDLSNVSIPWAVAGCRLQIGDFPFTAPLDGFGFLLSHESLNNMIGPIRCMVGDRQSPQCALLKSNGNAALGEETLFQEGMSLSELMHAYVTKTAIADYRKWSSTGLCLRSDL